MRWNDRQRRSLARDARRCRVRLSGDRVRVSSCVNDHPTHGAARHRRDVFRRYLRAWRPKADVLGYGLSAVLSLILAALVWSDQVEVWHVALGAFLNGVFWTIDFPARRTLLGEAAGHEQVGVAMSLDSITGNGTRMLGPALGESSWPRPDCLGFIYSAPHSTP